VPENRLKWSYLLFTFIVCFVFSFSTVAYSDGYYVRMVYETSKCSILMRAEEVYESGDYKLVIVSSLNVLFG